MEPEKKLWPVFMMLLWILSYMPQAVLFMGEKHLYPVNWWIWGTLQVVQFIFAAIAVVSMDSWANREFYDYYKKQK